MNEQAFSEDKDKCPICSAEAKVRAASDLFDFLCPRCGRFGMVGTAMAMCRTNRLDGRNLANAAGWVRAHPGITFNSKNLDQLQNIKTPTVAERATKVLMELGKRHPNAGSRFEANFGDPAMRDWMGISWSADYPEVQYLFCEYLIRRGLIEGDIQKVISGPDRLRSAFITPEGHSEIERQLTGGAESSIGFCAMWFSEEMLPAWSDAISPAITEAGYQPERIDNVQHNNKIDDEIVAMIRKSRLVVADFTGNRGGVYFEAGFALGLSIPVIWTIRADHLADVHFDNRQYNFIVWDSADLKAFRTALRNRIEATIGRGPR